MATCTGGKINKGRDSICSQTDSSQPDPIILHGKPVRDKVVHPFRSKMVVRSIAVLCSPALPKYLGRAGLQVNLSTRRVIGVEQRLALSHIEIVLGSWLWLRRCSGKTHGDGGEWNV